MTNEEQTAKKERERQKNRERAARYRARKKAEANNAQVENPPSATSSYHELSVKLNKMATDALMSIGVEGVRSAWLRAFGRRGNNESNQPQIQNARVKAVNLLPNRLRQEHTR